jgi:hypothetical protein
LLQNGTWDKGNENHHTGSRNIRVEKSIMTGQKRNNKIVVKREEAVVANKKNSINHDKV